MDPQEESREAVPESDAWDPVPGSTGRQAADSPGESAQLFEEGVSEEEHDQMRQASWRTRRATNQSHNSRARATVIPACEEKFKELTNRKKIRHSFLLLRPSSKSICINCLREKLIGSLLRLNASGACPDKRGD